MNKDTLSSLSKSVMNAQYYKDTYPPGTRIILVSMGKDPNPISDGTKGTVVCVDDIGTVHVKFDNGRLLGMCPEVDRFRKLTEEE